jgi:hypothetical protein
VQIDAHGDLREAYQGNPFSHASVMARVVEDGHSLVQVGIRSISQEEIARIEKTDRITTFFAANILDPSGPYEGKASRWIPEVVADQETGLLLREKDSVAELADKILIILKHPEYGRQLGKNGRQLMEERYSWPKVAGNMEMLYDSLFS